MRVLLNPFVRWSSVLLVLFHTVVLAPQHATSLVEPDQHALVLREKPDFIYCLWRELVHIS